MPAEKTNRNKSCSYSLSYIPGFEEYHQPVKIVVLPNASILLVSTLPVLNVAFSLLLFSKFFNQAILHLQD